MIASGASASLRRNDREVRALGSRAVVLVGEPLLTDALARALSCSSRHRLDVTQIRCASLQKPAGTAANTLLAAESVVWIPPPTMRAAVVLSVVHRLRSQLTWEGQLIIIAASAAERECLLNAELFGTLGAGVRLRNVAGHHVLGRPVSVAETLALVEHPEVLDRRIWRALAQSADTLSAYHAEIEILTRRTHSGVNDLAANVERLLNRLDDFDWSALLHDHEQERVLEELRGSRLAGGACTTDRCRNLLERLGRVVSSTFVGAQHGTTDQDSGGRG